MTTQPTFFIPHGGGPCFFMDWNPPDAWDNMRTFLEGLIPSLPECPKAILVITAHWEADKPTVSAQVAPDLLFDYNGFPPHTYELTWPAPGNPQLAQRIRDLLNDAGIDSAADSSRGFDHGVFVPMKVALPNADIPTVAMSLRGDLDPAFHIELGRALAPLRDEGVLILGSGFSYHNLGSMMGGKDGPKGDETFDTWLTETLTGDPATRTANLKNWENAPDARLAHPREEHLAPVFVAAGAALSDKGVKVYDDHVMGIRASGFQFG